MLRLIRPGLTLLLIMSAMTGVLYPAVMTVIAQTLFQTQANGSLIKDAQGRVLGSGLIGQNFDETYYFWGRPSATIPFAYNAAASSGSNLGPTNPALMRAVSARIQVLKNAEPDNQKSVPVDLVTASASGLDPHISVAAAEYQLKRVAKVRQLSEPEILNLIKRHTEERQWWILGEPRVNVLKLNLALDDLYGMIGDE